jgi:acetyl esterase/lipase
MAYTNREPATDILAVLQHVRQHAAALGIDENRIGLWASSGNVPVALSMLMRDAPERPKCAALCYGLMLDLDGADGVAEAATMWKFSNPCAGKSIEDLAPDVPLFIARAGRDQMPRLNETLDRFVAKALTGNLPLTVVNHPEGPHAFDLFHDSETTRGVIRHILSFMQFHLAAAGESAADSRKRG